MLITNFSSGELSPTLNGRVDLGQYFQAAQRLENFEIIPTGGIKRRVGTQRLTAIDENSRLIPFILDKDNVFLFQAYAFTLKIWKIAANGNLTLLQTITFSEPDTQPTQQNFGLNKWYYKNANDEYVKATTYQSGTTYYYNYFDFISLAEIRDIQYAQNYNVIVMVNKNHEPVILEYSQTTHLFKCSYMHFNFEPEVILDDDYEYVMLALNYLPNALKVGNHYEFTYQSESGAAKKIYPDGVTDIYCVYESHLYKYDETKGWEQTGDDPESGVVFTTENNFPGAVAFFNNRLWLASTIKEQQKIWASAIPDTSDRYANDPTKSTFAANDFSTYTKYVTVNKSVKDADLHMFTCDIKKSDVNTTTHTTVLTNVSQDLTSSLAKDKSLYYVSGDTVPVGTKVVAITSNTITISTDKIPIPEPEPVEEGETPAEAKLENQVYTIQLWHNATVPDGNDYEYIVVNNNITRADDSFNFEIASDENDAIMFMASNKFLAVGTESSIWSIAASSSATSISAVMQGRYGSDQKQGQIVATATIYLAQGKKGIREFYFDNQSEAFQTNNIAILAEHMLTESAAVDFDYMSNPYNRILVTRSDGTIASLLYDKTNGIMGWNRITRTSGAIKDLAVTRGPDENDLVFMVVQDGKDAAGKDLFYIERLDAGQKIYLDSWKVYAGSTAGYTDKAYVYNATQNKTAPADDIPADFSADTDEVYIGYLIKSYIKSMPVMNNDPTGKKRIVSLLVRFLESDMPVLKVTGLPDENFYDVEAPFSGIKEITYPGQSDRDVFFELETTSCKNTCILSVNAKIV